MQIDFVTARERLKGLMSEKIDTSKCKFKIPASMRTAQLVINGAKIILKKDVGAAEIEHDRTDSVMFESELNFIKNIDSIHDAIQQNKKRIFKC